MGFILIYSYYKEKVFQAVKYVSTIRRRKKIQIYKFLRQKYWLKWVLYKFTVISRRKYFKRSNKVSTIRRRRKYKYTSFWHNNIHPPTHVIVITRRNNFKRGQGRHWGWQWSWRGYMPSQDSLSRTLDGDWTTSSLLHWYRKLRWKPKN